jgi:hypothetical protein
MPNILHLTLWLLAAMHTFVPVEEHRWTENEEVTEARYEAIARDIAFAVSQPYVQPVFADRDPIAARAKTGLLLVAIAADESHFRDDVTMCKKGGDSNKSWGLFQTVRSRDRTCSGMLGASGVAIEMVQESFRICRGSDPRTWLAEYTDGLAWNTPRAERRSARRMGRAMTYWREHPYAQN